MTISSPRGKSIRPRFWRRQAPWNGDRPKGDAIVTNRPNIAIGIVTADCGPVLFSDPKNKVIGAAHAGWRGATEGILEATIDKMRQLGAKVENIQATLGPTISGENYEVGPEFIENLHKTDPSSTNFLSPSPRTGHAMFDLPNYIIERLQKIGVSARWTGQCTYADEARFSPTGAQHTKMNPIMAGKSRRLA